jgi:hypothetical protein
VYGTSIALVRRKSSSHIPSQDATVCLLPVRKGSQPLISTFRASCVTSHTEAMVVRAIPLRSAGWGGYTSFKQGCHVPWFLAGSPSRPSALSRWSEVELYGSPRRKYIHRETGEFQVPSAQFRICTLLVRNLNPVRDPRASSTQPSVEYCQAHPRRAVRSIRAKPEYCPAQPR